MIEAIHHGGHFVEQLIIQELVDLGQPIQVLAFIIEALLFRQKGLDLEAPPPTPDHLIADFVQVHHLIQDSEAALQAALEVVHLEVAGIKKDDK